MAVHNELGKRGEDLATDYLTKKGYRVLQRNYSFKNAEVDIICEYEGELIIVEVKTRQNEFMAGPEETVTKKKQLSIIRVANIFIEENEIDLETRFDIVSIIMNKKETKIDHLEGAFYPTI